MIFLDPPYETGNEEVSAVIKLMHDNNFLKPDALAIVERATKSDEFVWPAPLKAVKTRDYGTATFYFATYEM